MAARPRCARAGDVMCALVGLRGVWGGVCHLVRSQKPASPALELVCSSAECVDKMEQACRKVLPCGHPCGGNVGEATCLPCVHGCDGGGVDGYVLCASLLVVLEPQACCALLCAVCEAVRVRACPFPRACAGMPTVLCAPRP